MEARLTRLINDLRASLRGSDADILRVETGDGANLALRHYRPEPGAPFNDGNQPILLMPPALCNFNVYDIHTPGGKEPWSSLPDRLPTWAENDERIRSDPMLLYSLAYYLYSRGYDVWMFNYRYQGRGKSRSYGPFRADIDHFAVYDLKASIVKVNELTGKKPVYVGYSMGGTTGLMFFQGIHHVAGPDRKVESDPRLVEERNAGSGPQAAKGFINLDGPFIPSGTGALKLPLVPMITWYGTAMPFYLSLKPLLRFFPRVGGKLTMFALSIAWSFKRLLPPFFHEMISVVYSINPGNIDPDVLLFAGKYSVDGAAAHMIGQFLDAARCGKLRESCRRRNTGKFGIFPEQEASDGLYYYSDNIDKMSLPSLFLADATLDITDPGDIRKSFDSKTRHPLDEFHLMAGTAHVDLTIGLKAPYETFPVIGEWLEKLCAG